MLPMYDKRMLFCTVRAPQKSQGFPRRIKALYRFGILEAALVGIFQLYQSAAGLNGMAGGW